MSNHSRSGGGLEVSNRPSRLGPARTAETVAIMLAEERADTVRTEISDTVLTVPRQDDGVGEDNLPLVDAALEVAENVKSAGDVVAEVTECLHDLSPYPGVVDPTAVAVELLVIVDKRLREHFVVTPLAAIVNKCPYLWYVDFDSLVHDAQLVEHVDHLQRLVDGLDVEGKIVVGEDCARLKPLGNARLPGALALSVGSFGHPAESSLCKGILQINEFKGRRAGVVVSAACNRR